LGKIFGGRRVGQHSADVAILKYEDYHISFCSSNEDVIPLVTEIIPNVTLVDIRMSGKNGYEICKELKTQETVGKLPVILLGAEEFFEEDKARECDYDGFIAKPFLTEEIIKSLDVIIKRSQKLFPEIQEISERQTIAPSEPYSMPVTPSEMPSLSTEMTEGAPTQEMVNQIESATRDSAVAYKDLFETEPSPVATETHEGQEGSSHEEIQEESPRNENILEQESANEIQYEEEDTQDLAPENVEPVEEEKAEVEEPQEEAPILESPEEKIDDENVPDSSPLEEELDYKEVIRQIDKVTSDDYDDEVSAVEVKKEEAPVEREETSQVSQQLLSNRLYESLDREVKNFVESLDRQEILSEIKKLFQDSIEKMCKEILPDIAERKVKEKLEEILKEKS